MKTSAAILLVSFCLGLSGFAAAQDGGEAEGESAGDKPILVLRALDKVTARITMLSVKIGETKRFGTLDITAKYCRSRPPIEPPETFGYLQIVDRPVDSDQNKLVFEGWMLATSPGLNPLEHAVYDVWVLSCKTASGEDFTGDDDQFAGF